jgi:hypothetical protein
MVKSKKNLERLSPKRVLTHKISQTCKDSTIFQISQTMPRSSLTIHNTGNFLKYTIRYFLILPNQKTGENRK